MSLQHEGVDSSDLLQIPAALTEEGREKEMVALDGYTRLGLMRAVGTLPGPLPPPALVASGGGDNTRHQGAPYTGAVPRAPRTRVPTS